MQKHHVSLSVEDKAHLKALVSKGESKARVIKRAMGLLYLDEGKTYKFVEALLGVSYPTVKSWASKYKTQGLDCLKDLPRSGRPLEYDGEVHSKVTALACSKPPEGYARWSLRLLSDRLVELELTDSISHTEVGRILKKTNCNLTARNNGVSAS